MWQLCACQYKLLYFATFAFTLLGDSAQVQGP